MTAPDKGTPLTDRAVEAKEANHTQLWPKVVDADFARTLEREALRLAGELERLESWKAMHVKMVCDWCGDMGEALGKPSEDFNPQELIKLAKEVAAQAQSMKEKL